MEGVRGGGYYYRGGGGGGMGGVGGDAWNSEGRGTYTQGELVCTLASV